jgi:serine/threonine-protein kinase HSL1 (negative regulator of Swe1 kinase)
MTGQVAAVKIVSRRSAIELRSKSVLKMDHVFANMPARPNQKRIPFGIDREIVIMKVIEHPNIIKVYDVWENRGEMYLVLELVEGGELFEYIVANVRLPEAEAVRIFRQLLSGITHCHRFLLCHRDIKPENILLTGEGNVKIVDFGMASMQPKGSWLDTSCGSPHYAAPEVAQGQRYKGDKADIWSVGVVLYVMLCGSVPFGAHFDIEDELKGTDNLRRVLEEVVYNQPTYPSDLSDAAVDLIQLMLRKDPCERITAEEIWSHPLLLRYESYAKSPKYAQSWIGGPPTSLTSAECGPQFESKEDIDLDIVDNLCTLFHTNDTEALVNGLMSEE